jgi:hypothetical protein
MIATPMAGLEPENILVEVTHEGRLMLHGALLSMEHEIKELLVDEWSVGVYHRPRSTSATFHPCWLRATSITRHPQHLVDAAYTDAESMVQASKAYQVNLVGPSAKDYRWQARAHNGYALSDFSIDWEREQARCPQGQKSLSWTPTRTRNQEIIKIKFGFATCGACPVRSLCTRGQATQPVCAATCSALCFRGCSPERTDGSVQAAVCKAGRHRRGPCGSECGAWAYSDLVTLENLVPTFSMSSPQLP